MILDDPHGSCEQFTAVVINPGSSFIAVSEATETFALNVDGNCQRGAFFGFLT